MPLFWLSKACLLACATWRGMRHLLEEFYEPHGEHRFSCALQVTLVRRSKIAAENQQERGEQSPVCVEDLALPGRAACSSVLDTST